MSSKVQMWRTPVTAPSGANNSSVCHRYPDVRMRLGGAVSSRPPGKSDNRMPIQYRGRRSCMARVAFIGNACAAAFLRARAGRGDWPSCPWQAAFGPMTMGLKRLVERALEMKAGFASVKFARTPAAAKRGRLARASPVAAVGPASRSQATRGWRRSGSNHPTRVDAVGLEAASRAPRRTRPTCWSVPASGGRPRSSRCIWPNETIIWNASANSAKRPHDRILDLNQCIMPALPVFFLSAPIASLFRHLPAAWVSGRAHRLGAAQFFNAAVNSSTL